MNKKKLLALLMALVMTLTLVPVTALATETTKVAKVGTTEYSTLPEAVSAAIEGDVVEIIAAGNYTLPNLPKNITIEGKVDGVVFNHTSGGNIAGVPNGATFKNVTFNLGDVDYHGFYAAGAITMENCTINGKIANYGSMEFTNCTFSHANNYAVWIYGNATDTVSFHSCNFSGKNGKFLNIYNDSGNKTQTIVVDNCHFNSDGNAKKAALNVKGAAWSVGSGKTAQNTNGARANYYVTISGCTVEGLFPEAGTPIDNNDGTTGIVLDALVQIDDWVEGLGNTIEITLDSKKIYPAVVEPTATVTVDENNSVTAEIDDGYFTEEATADVTIAPASVETTVAAVTFNTEAVKTLANEGKLTLTITKTNETAAAEETPASVTYEVKLVNEQNQQVFTTAAENVNATVKLPVPDSFTGTVYVHHDNDVIPCEVQGSAGAKYVEVTVPHFSEFTVTQQNTSKVAVIEGENTKYSDDLAYAIANAASGATVRLLADIDLTDSIDVDSTVTLDLNGKTIAPATGATTGAGKFSANSDHDYLIGVKRGGSLTINDSSNPSTGKIDSADLWVAIKATLKGEAGTGDAATIIVNGGAITGYYYGISGNGMRHGTVITVNGGTIKGTDGTAIFHPQDGTLTISNGTFIGEDAGIEVRSGTLNITGGTFEAKKATFVCNPNGSGTTTEGAAIAIAQHTTNKAIDVSITGGNFIVPETEGATAVKLAVKNPQNNAFDNVEVEGLTSLIGTSNEVPEGYIWVETNGVSSLAKAVAQVGETKYASLEDALKAISNGGTVKTNPTSGIQVKTFKADGEITLLADCEGDGFVIDSGSNLTIDFNHKTYTISGHPVGSDTTETIGLQLLKDSDITFKNGAIYGNNNTTGEYLIRLIQNYSNLTLDNMELGMVGKYYNQSTMSNCNGTIVIKDSTVNAPDFSHLNYTVEEAASSLGAVAFSVGTFSSYTGVSVTVTGNSTINGNVSVDPEDNANAVHNSLTLTSGALNGNIVMESAASEATVTKADAFTQTAPEGYEWVANTNGTSTLREKDIKVLGGSLRKRVDNTQPIENGKYQPVYTETDLRFGFKVKDVENFDRTRSFFTYTIGGVERTVTAGKIDSEGNCNLVLTNIPVSAYETGITVKLTMYTNGSDTPIESDEMTRSVAYVAGLLKGDSSWNSYATELLAAAGINQ